MEKCSDGDVTGLVWWDGLKFVGRKKIRQHLSVEDEGIKNQVSAIQALTDSTHISSASHFPQHFS